MTETDEQDERIDAIVGTGEDYDFRDAREKFCRHLDVFLQLPCDVTGIEDFNWEEFYILGPGDLDEYEELMKTQPSYEDTFELIAIEKDTVSEWMLFRSDDLAARTRRKSDGKEFYLGLAELKLVDDAPPNRQLLSDYAVWLMDAR